MSERKLRGQHVQGPEKAPIAWDVITPFALLAIVCGLVLYSLM